jgi:hypothetical protein
MIDLDVGFCGCLTVGVIADLAMHLIVAEVTGGSCCVMSVVAFWTQ